MNKIILSLLIAFIFSLSFVKNTNAQQSISTIRVGGVSAVLIKPNKPIGSLILLAGGNGEIGVEKDGVIKYPGNQLVRTRMNYAQKGFAVLVPDAGYNLTELVDHMKNIQKPVTVVGTSRGTQRASVGIYKGARPDKLVLTSGFLSNASGDSENVINILGSPNILPTTLVIHHKHDHCKHTSPEGVQDFINWSKGKSKVVWLDGGDEVGNPCEAQSYHGFKGLDQKVVDLVSQFSR